MTNETRAMTPLQIPPFPKELELVSDRKSVAVPNEPLIDESVDTVNDFVCREIECRVLDELAPSFYVFCKRRSSHIDALHDYVGTGRNVTITENPGLHLVRNYTMIYIKPIPQCLLNHTFWFRYLAAPSQSNTPSASTNPRPTLSIACRSALGFLRSYAYLIHHESDFRLAQSALLIPQHIDYTAFQHFIQPFRHLSDAVVSPRYHYGHIRLTRLNLAVRILRPRSLGRRSYHPRHWHTAQYLARLAAPVLFLFACVTLILSSMQVGLAAQPAGISGIGMDVEDAWQPFSQISVWFAVVVVLGIMCIACCAVAGIFMYIINRVFVGIKENRAWRRREKVVDEEKDERK
jgi:hypothetical protein